jgi:hypothetical protein
LIGTNADGTDALPNGLGMIVAGANNVIGGMDTAARNLIGANGLDGILISGDSNVVQGNYIGTNADGTDALPNGMNGVEVSGMGNIIGGATIDARNVIAGNKGAGISISGSSNLVQGNLIGTDVTGAAPLANTGDGVSISSAANANTIGGAEAGAGNVIGGNTNNGISVGGKANVVQGNRIGTTADGDEPLANATGIVVSGMGNTIGGTDTGAGNLISGNAGPGITLNGLGAVGNLVQGNLIGTNADGTQPLANAGDGISVTLGALNTIGGTDTGAGNLIAGNTNTGITLAGNLNLVQGNRIGTTADGTTPLHNATGVVVSGQSNVIGGTVAGAGNLISGNAGDGIIITGSGNAVQGNFIGTDASGTAPLANNHGITIFGGSNNVIGGMAGTGGNVISGNLLDGIQIVASTGTVVLGNLIGTDVNGDTLANAGNGVALLFSSNNTIGQVGPGLGNVIAHSGNDGVLVNNGTGNGIHGNSIFASTHLGIELINGANGLQPFPFLTLAASGGGITFVSGAFFSSPNSTFTLEFFANTVCNPSGFGEGEQFLGFITVPTDFLGTASFTFTVAVSVPPGEFITATATNIFNSTSQFSACMRVVGSAAARTEAGGSREDSVAVAAALLPSHESFARASVPVPDRGTILPTRPVAAGDRLSLSRGLDAFFSALGEQTARAGQGSMPQSVGPATPRFGGELSWGSLLDPNSDLFKSL